LITGVTALVERLPMEQEQKKVLVVAEA